MYSNACIQILVQICFLKAFSSCDLTYYEVATYSINPLSHPRLRISFVSCMFEHRQGVAELHTQTQT